MSYKNKGEVYAGSTNDVLIVIEQVAQKMAETDLREVEVYLPFSSGNDATIRMKR